MPLFLDPWLSRSELLCLYRGSETGSCSSNAYSFWASTPSKHRAECATITSNLPSTPEKYQNTPHSFFFFSFRSKCKQKLRQTSTCLVMQQTTGKHSDFTLIGANYSGYSWAPNLTNFYKENHSAEVITYSPFSKTAGSSCFIFILLRKSNTSGISLLEEQICKIKRNWKGSRINTMYHKTIAQREIIPKLSKRRKHARTTRAEKLSNQNFSIIKKLEVMRKINFGHKFTVSQI